MYVTANSEFVISLLLCLTRLSMLSLIAWQFAIHQGKQEDKKTTEDQSRLADNFEAYVYALYLDQGIETVYKFLCPIYVKKLYSQAKWLKIPLPTKKTVVDIADDGTPYVPSVTEKIKESGGYSETPSSRTTIC